MNRITHLRPLTMSLANYNSMAMIGNSPALLEGCAAEGSSRYGDYNFRRRTTCRNKPTYHFPLHNCRNDARRVQSCEISMISWYAIFWLGRLREEEVQLHAAFP